MKHWNSTEIANVCGNCGFQTFSLPVYKRHSKHCSGDPLKVKEMSCEFLNGSMKEPLHTISSKEFSESSGALKSQPSAGKNLLYCKLCEFSCSFSSQLISHIKRIHSNESKGHQEHISPDLNLYEIQMSNINGIAAIKSEPFLEAEELSTKKKIVLKKIKLEIPTVDGNLTAITGKTKESARSFEANLKTLSSPTSMVAVNLDMAEEKSRKCPECGFVAKSRDQLMSHKASHEATDIIYTCSECEYKTTVRKNFERHEWCHVVDGPFKCQFCSFSSNGENAVKRHISAYHTLHRPPQTNDKKSTSVKSSTIPPTNSIRTARVSSEPLDATITNDPLKRKPSLEKASNHPVSVAGASITSVKLEAIDSSSFVPSCPSTSSSLLLMQLKPETLGVVCPHCGLCFKENFLLEHHIKATHQKLTIQINNLTNRPLIQHDQKQLKKLEVSHLKQKSEPPPEPKASLLSQTKGLKGEQRIEIKMEEVSKVYKCGHCSFLVNEFGKLREHMESKVCQSPNATTSTMSGTAVTETVLQKLLTNDNPNKVYPKVPISSLISMPPSYVRSETQAIANSNSMSEFKTEAAPRQPDAYCAGQNELSILAREDPMSPVRDSTAAEESIKVNKNYICCLLCTYKTLSSKVLRKHLVRDHSSIICSKKILRDVIQKSVSMSIRQVGDNAQKQVNNWETATAQNTDAGSFEGQCSNAGESEVLLQMDVQCESENNPPAHLQEKKVSKQTTETSKFLPFKCSECGKRSNWKHVIKKHISDKHGSATILVLSSEDAESSYNSYHDQIARRISSRMMADKLRYISKDVAVNEMSRGEATNFTNGEMLTDSGMPPGLEGTSENHDLDPSASEQLGMSDLLRLKRFKCSVCIYRSNFRCDISRHLKKRHPDVNCYYSVMSLKEAKESLPHYSYTWPEAEALLLASSSSVKDENVDLKTLPGDPATKIDPAIERKAMAIISRLPFGSEEGKRCPICPFITNKAELLRLHMAYHQPQKRNCYSCPHCPYFVNTSRLLQHHITLHENDQFIKSVAAEKTATQQFNAYNLEFNYVKRNPKFICEDCPYTNNNRNEFWRHRKGHFERGIVPSDLKCQHCPYWAEDKRDWHLHCSLHGGMQRSFLKRRTDLAIGEFCRCDLADLKDFGDLACFKQLRCPSCTIRNPSVTYMRHHMLTHMAFTDAARFRIFDHDLDEADDTLGNLCTRLLNMNYSLVEECRSEPPPSQNSTEDEETQMPVLEKVTEMPDYSANIPSLKISLRLSPPIISSKSGDCLTPKLFYPSTVAACRRPYNSPQGALQEYKDDYILAAPEEIVEWNDSSACSEEPTAIEDPSEDAEEVETKRNVRRTEKPCPHSKTLFLLSLGILPTSFD